VTDKQRIAACFRPLAVLRAETREAALAVSTQQLVDDMIAIRTFPFRIGRESRVMNSDGKWIRKERPRVLSGLAHSTSNDLYLVDPGEPLQISREHLQIETAGAGRFLVVDRGSARGTVVAGRTIGGRDQGGFAPLADGDVIELGAEWPSPYRYRFITLD